MHSACAWTFASHLALHSALIFGGSTVPVHFGACISTEHDPLQVPLHVACAFILQLPPHLPLHSAFTLPEHLPSHVPAHWPPEAPPVVALPSHLPEQLPEQRALDLRVARAAALAGARRRRAGLALARALARAGALELAALALHLGLARGDASRRSGPSSRRTR